MMKFPSLTLDFVKLLAETVNCLLFLIEFVNVLLDDGKIFISYFDIMYLVRHANHLESY
jgi:hypothetical protein